MVSDVCQGYQSKLTWTGPVTGVSTSHTHTHVSTAEPMPLYTHILSSPSCPHYSPEHAISARAKGHICNAGDYTGGKTQVIGSNTFRRDTVMDVERFWRAIKHFRGLRKLAHADLTAATLLSDLEEEKKKRPAESKRFSSKSCLFGFFFRIFLFAEMRC